MIERIIIAGAGGQGIMLLGKILSEAAMREGKFVTWFPSYGAEVRGGTAHCAVVISDEEISSPYIEKPDTLIIMNGPSFQKFWGRRKTNGLAIINSSLTSAGEHKDACVFRQPFTDIAFGLGNTKVANMVALGYYIQKKGIIKLQSVLKAISDIAPEEKKGLIEINIRALKEGAKLK